MEVIVMKEIWKDIKGFEGVYQISNLGNCRSLDRYITYIQTNQHDPIGKEVKQFIKGRVLTPRLTKQGRRRVQLHDKDYYIYRLVVSNFIRPLEPGEEVNHIDGNKQNDRLDNLEICSRVENQNHAYNTGLNQNFEKAIRVEVNGVIYNSLGEASKAIGVSKQTLSKALKNPNHKLRKIQFTIKRV